MTTSNEVKVPVGLLDKQSLGLMRTLEKRNGVCDIQMSNNAPVSQEDIVSWEQMHSCIMADDLKQFYFTMNGFLLSWNVKMNEINIPVGRMEVRSIEKLNRLIVGSGNSKDPDAPTMADLHLDSDDDTKESDTTKPKFDHRSRIFELDPCDGYGKVCVVYRNTRAGVPAQMSDIWYVDRSLRWHRLADTFVNYYRLMLTHIGLPEWQLAFTDIGLSPPAKQWFSLYCPVRLAVEGQTFDSSLDSERGQQPAQLDIARVFKGKQSDKKKPITSQILKKKPPMPAVKPGSGNKATTAGNQASKPPNAR